MAGGDLRPHAAHPRLFRQHFEETRLRIVDFIAVDIHQAAVTLGEVHQKHHRADPFVAGVLIVRNAAHHVGAHLDGARHQLPAVGIRFDSLLRKGDNLQIDEIGGLLFHRQQRLQGRQRRVGDIHMGADVLDAEIAQHADGFQRSLTGVLRGNTRFALAPAGDAFKQGAAAVPLRLARGEGGVKMDMRLDEGRDRQPALGVDIPGVGSLHRGLGGDAVNHPVLQVKGKQRLLAAQASVNNFHGGSCKWFCDKRQITSATEALR